MNLAKQKEILARALGIGKDRIKIKPEYADIVSKAMTKEDLRILVHKGIIEILPLKGQSRGRARLLHEKKKKGRRRGPGSRKGKKTARLPKKRMWINRVRAQRKLLRILKSKGLIDKKLYRKIYIMIKSGQFRSRRHMLLWLKERHLLKE